MTANQAFMEWAIPYLIAAALIGFALVLGAVLMIAIALPKRRS